MGDALRVCHPAFPVSSFLGGWKRDPRWSPTLALSPTAKGAAQPPPWWPTQRARSCWWGRLRSARQWSTPAMPLLWEAAMLVFHTGSRDGEMPVTIFGSNSYYFFWGGVNQRFVQFLKSVYFAVPFPPVSLNTHRPNGHQLHACENTFTSVKRFIGRRMTEVRILRSCIGSLLTHHGTFSSAAIPLPCTSLLITASWIHSK